MFVNILCRSGKEKEKSSMISSFWPEKVEKSLLFMEKGRLQSFVEKTRNLDLDM